MMPEARDGDLATYRLCTDPDCPANLQSFQHVHLESVEREDGELVEMPPPPAAKEAP